MNEKITTETTAQKTRKPTWWNDSLDTSWKKASAGILSGWDKLSEGGKKLEHSLAEEALAFGHGAREIYPKMSVWAGELEDKLKADWKPLAKSAADSWESVHTAVKHGWDMTKNAVLPNAKA